MRILLAVVIFISVQSIQAQRWLDVGLKGGWGLSMLLNGNYFDDKDVNPDITSGFTVGGKLGYNLSNFHEITIDIMYSKFNSNFEYDVEQPGGAFLQYSQVIYFNTLDFILMYRNNSGGRYFEIGPKYSLLSNANESITNSNFNNSRSIDHLIAKSAYGMMIGFGSYMLGTENFGITLGFRVGYDLSDVISSEGKSENYITGKDYDSYKSTHAFTAMLMTEFNFDFGYLAKAKCSKRTKLILF